MGEMATMGRQGDTKMTWDANNPDEVDAARKTFKELRAKGYLAYSVKKDGDKDVQITEFDPHAQKIIMAMPMRGGM